MRTFRIPNKLTYSGWVTGIIFSFVVNGKKGILYSVTGIFIPIVVLLLLFSLRLLGAGDIKLFSAIGSFIYSDIIRVIIFSMIIAAFYGAFLVLKRFISYIKNGAWEMGTTKIHFSICIAGGLCVYAIGGAIL